MAGFDSTSLVHDSDNVSPIALPFNEFETIDSNTQYSINTPKTFLVLSYVQRYINVNVSNKPALWHMEIEELCLTILNLFCLSYRMMLGQTLSKKETNIVNKLSVC